MVTQDKNEHTSTDAVLMVNKQMSQNAGAHSVFGSQLKEQISSVDDPTPKVRKPYTITKQRERWTEEEHKKFLEALKLYGRAWRRIEEHVGSKTAVQIRSHAQKFFTKVVRESTGTNVNSEEPIEIPPPRPKRKPMHPYPRKQAQPIKKGVLIPKLPVGSASPNLSFSEEENQSPTSVLSVVGSDTLGSADSSSPAGSISPDSSAADANPNSSFLSEPITSPAEQNGSPPVPESAASVQDEQMPQKFELFPNDDVVAKESFAEEESTRCLKLFGRTLLITNSDRPTLPVTASSKSPRLDQMNEGKQAQTWSCMPADFSAANYMWSSGLNGMPGAVYFMQFQNDNSNQKEAATAAPLAWWTCYGGAPFPLIPFHNSEFVKTQSDSDMAIAQDKEGQKEGSWTGSNNELVEGGIGDKNQDMEAQSGQLSVYKEEKEIASVCESKPMGKRASFEHQIRSPGNCMKGFVPYKRHVAERDTQSSTIPTVEREEQRIRLCL